VSIEEFYRNVRDEQTRCEDPFMQTFIDCLLASADYESFYKVMSREGAKSASRKYKTGVSSSSAMKSPPSKVNAAADAKADSKSVLSDSANVSFKAGAASGSSEKISGGGIPTPGSSTNNAAIASEAKVVEVPSAESSDRKYSHK
jgi:hypothetical protein